MASREKADRASTPLKTPIPSRPGSRIGSTPSPRPSSRSSRGAPSPSPARRRLTFGENVDESHTFVDVAAFHPGNIAESSSLASVVLPAASYQLTRKLKNGLSQLQKETIQSACQQHETTLPNDFRAGFFIGDGTGVGKGRIIAGLISENRQNNRKRAIWISASSNLKNAAQQDLKDIGAEKIKVYSLKEMIYGHKISADVNGGIKKGVIFSTYSCLIGESKTTGEQQTRMDQLLKWCHDDFDGLIVFDESHLAKNCVAIGSTEPTKTGLAVLELQNKLPNARIVYVTATGASEPRHLGYMVRLGLWGTPFV